MSFTTTQEIKNIKLSIIRVNANNPRKSLNEQSLEEQILYFDIAKSLRSENFAKVGIDPEKHYLTDCDRWHLVQSLTEEQKIIIKRDFIVGNFSDAARGNYTAVMLMDYAKQHAPDKFEEIQETHNEVYEKRHTRIEEKIAVIEQNELN